MKAIAWMTAAAVLSAALLGIRFGREVWLGMLAPLLVVSASWVTIERVYRQNPERLNTVMMTAFAGKLIFFGLYLVVAIAVFGVEPVTFGLSLTSYFIALHLTEALLLKRMLAS